MISETDQRDTNGTGPSVARLTRKTLTTAHGALENRLELFMVEVEEEEARLVKLVVYGIVALLSLMLLTATVIFLVPEPYRLWAALGFTLLYAIGTVWAILTLKSLLK